MLERIVPIRIRLTLWYVLLVAITLAAFGGFLYLNLARGLYAEVDAGLRVVAQEAARGIDNENGALRFQNSEMSASAALRRAGQDVILRLLDETGDAVDGIGDYTDLPLSESPETGFSTVQVSSEPWRVCTLIFRPPAPQQRYVLQVAKPLAEIDETLERVAGILMLGIPFVLFVAALGGVFISGRALSPIDRLTRLAEEVSAEDLSRRLDMRLPNDEVGRLARTFANMLARLDAAFQRERQFTQDAAHELRTPLTIMKGTIDVALSRPRHPEEHRAALSELGTQVDRLAHLAESLLVLARTETAKADLNLEPLDVALLLSGLVGQLQPVAAARGVALRYDGPLSLPLRGDQDRLIRLFLNLVDNAIKYTPRGGKVIVQVKTKGETVEVAVRDTGHGIPEEHLPHLFERFYRVDKARSRDEGGVGLGLAIAKHMAELHGGRIRVTSAPGKGSVFTVSLPVAPANRLAPRAQKTAPEGIARARSTDRKRSS